MAEIRLTQAQQNVVAHHGSSLLVSAAAGSGKTKVLVDRLLDKVCDPKLLKNVDDFLIITFTNAAASELRGKIAAAISERLQKEPDNRHLQRQMGRLYLAQISTVHAFCKTLLRTYANELDIPSDFRVGEGLEIDMLRSKCMEQTLNDCYQNLNQHPAQRVFLDTLALARDDRKAGELIFTLEEYANCHTDPTRWLEEQIALTRNEASEELLQTPWGQSLRKEIQRKMGLLARRADYAIALCRTSEVLAEKYIPTLVWDRDFFQQVQQMQTWAQLHEVFSPAFPKLKPIPKKDAPEEKELVSKIRDDYKKTAKKLLEMFAFSAEQAQEQQRATKDGVIGLLELVQDYRNQYQMEKRAKRILDFQDLEHETIRLLTQRGTQMPTAIAKSVSNRFYEIMVDEYQDTNAVQDLIFRAISRRESNLFMVGDVKQSIYRFRLADPTIFLYRYEHYTDYASASEGEPCRILLSENFRSDAEILDAANSVFAATMTKQVGGLDYGPAEALRAGKPQNTPTKVDVELYCLNTGNRNDHGDDEANDQADGTPKSEAEAAFVAEKIQELLQEAPSIPDGETLRKIRPGDIAILLRSANVDAPDYVAALAKAGIRAICDSGQNILDTVELESVAAVLQIIHNPHQDIPLLTAMTSPIFAISNDTIAQTRAKHRNMNLFDAVCAERERYPEVDAFISQIRALQQQAVFCNLHELYQTLENQLSLRIIFGAMPQGETRLQNLDTFADQVAKFEADGEKTLSQFADYLDRWKEQGMTADAESENENCVRIQSIHKSKGLEYPVVFLAGLSKTFNMMDVRASVLVHPELGAGCEVVNESLRIHYPSPAKRAIAIRQQQETISEEMRVLYVAMTRPKHRLIMTYCGKNLPKKLDDLGRMLLCGGSRQAAEEAKCMGDWVLMTALQRLESGELFAQMAVRPEAAASEIPWKVSYQELGENIPAQIEGLPTAAPTPKISLSLPEDNVLRRQLQFQYPYAAATKLPTKLTATQMKGRHMDLETAEQAEPVLLQPSFRFDKPNFTTSKRKLSPTQRGTATHLAMQFIDYAKCTSLEGVRQELERLQQERFLNKLQYEAVDAETIFGFFRSELGQQTMQADRLVREFKFSLFVDGGDFSPDAVGEKILLQGVTDCCAFYPDGMTVIDFKTDRISAGAEEKAAQYYIGQMKTYAMALSRIFNRPVKRCVLYFFSTGRWVEA